MTCPECNSEEIVERDCVKCEGDGLYDIGSDRLCDVCEGMGSNHGEWECLKCGLNWDE